MSTGERKRYPGPVVLLIVGLVVSVLSLHFLPHAQNVMHFESQHLTTIKDELYGFNTVDHNVHLSYSGHVYYLQKTDDTYWAVPEMVSICDKTNDSASDSDLPSSPELATVVKSNGKLLQHYYLHSNELDDLNVDEITKTMSNGCQKNGGLYIRTAGLTINNAGGLSVLLDVNIEKSDSTQSHMAVILESGSGETLNVFSHFSLPTDVKTHVDSEKLLGSLVQGKDGMYYASIDGATGIAAIDTMGRFVEDVGPQYARDNFQDYPGFRLGLIPTSAVEKNRFNGGNDFTGQTLVVLNPVSNEMSFYVLTVDNVLDSSNPKYEESNFEGYFDDEESQVFNSNANLKYSYDKELMTYGDQIYLLNNGNRKIVKRTAIVDKDISTVTRYSRYGHVQSSYVLSSLRAKFPGQKKEKYWDSDFNVYGISGRKNGPTLFVLPTFIDEDENYRGSIITVKLRS